MRLCPRGQTARLDRVGKSAKRALLPTLRVINEDTTMRNIKVAAAQLGPVQKADTRQAVVARMLELMRQAKGCDLIVYPELALTTFFPRWHYQDRSDADVWFEREMPGAVTRPLFEEAERAGMAMSF